MQATANTKWHGVSIPLSALGATNMTVTRLQIQESTGAAQPVFYLDEVRFTSG